VDAVVALDRNHICRRSSERCNTVFPETEQIDIAKKNPSGLNEKRMDGGQEESVLSFFVIH
jgi:hypothetical protein